METKDLVRVQAVVLNKAHCGGGCDREMRADAEGVTRRGAKARSTSRLVREAVEKGTWRDGDLIGCYCSGWEVFQERLHRNGTLVLPNKPGSTLAVHPTNAVQKLVSVLRLESGSPENVFYANRLERVHEPRRKPEKYSYSTQGFLHAAIQVSLTAPVEKTCAEIRFARETQHQKHRLFKEKDVLEISPF